MNKFILILALALLLCSCADAATKIGLDRLNWGQSLPEDANVRFNGGYIINTSLDPGWVTIGDGMEFDIDVDIASDTEGHVFQDAIDMAMERSGNSSVNIFIGPCVINNTAGDEIYLNYSGLEHGVPLRITGSGSAWYGSGTLIKSDGIVIGNAFTDGVDGAWLSDFYLMGNGIGIGISCNGTAERVNLERLRVGNYDVGIQFENYYNNVIQNVVVGACTSGSINLTNANHNRLDNVIIAQPNDCPDDYGLKLVGYCNIVNIDIGVAGEDTGSKGIWIIGDGNIIESCWVEPIASEGHRIYLEDAYRNTIHMDGIDQDEPYGSIALYKSNDNIIDPNWLPSRGGTSGSFTNITFYLSFDNRILMSPTSQTAGRGVLNRTDAEVLDYGSPVRPAAPSEGYWYVGAVVWNSAPTIGQPAGWVCTATGAPGTWTAMGNL